jgi:Protein of unknown function (DUF3383)
MPVEGIPPRDSVVTFGKQYASYFPGERAAFTANEELVLVGLGVLQPPAAAPGNVDVPFVSQNGSVMNCTLGNWTNEPTSYAFQWKRGATNIGTNAATYTVVGADIGATLTCVVTATNAIGSTAAPASNGVVVTTPSTWTPAILTGGTVPDPAALLTTLEAITDASMAITINGTVVQMTPTSLAGAGTMLLIAALITSALGGNTVARCQWVVANNHFTITTNATGAAATLTVASAPAAGTDISALCHFTTATGATLTQGTAS